MSERETITCRSMLNLVPLRWWTEFKRFVEEGEASAEFLVFFETSDGCQRAIEMILRDDPIMNALVAAIKESPDQDIDLNGYQHSS